MADSSNLTIGHGELKHIYISTKFPSPAIHSSLLLIQIKCAVLNGPHVTYILKSSIFYAFQVPYSLKMYTYCLAAAHELLPLLQTVGGRMLSCLEIITVTYQQQQSTLTFYHFMIVFKTNKFWNVAAKVTLNHKFCSCVSCWNVQAPRQLCSRSFYTLWRTNIDKHFTVTLYYWITFLN